MKEVAKGASKAKKSGAPIRLYARAAFTGFRRARMSQRSNQALVHIENCADKDSAKWYLGKRVAYVYKVKNNVNNTRYRCLWGKVMNTHGHNGAVRCAFRKNITPSAMGALLRVMLYPNKTL